MAKGLREAETFQRDLQAFERWITERGNSAFGGLGEHDDLVIAAALACWTRKRMSRVGFLRANL